MELTDSDREVLKRLRESAASNLVTLAEVRESIRHPGAARRRNWVRTVLLSNGHEATFTHEEQPFFVARHLSVSYRGGIDEPDRDTVAAIMVELGYTRPLTECYVWLEEFKKGQFAVNILEPIDETVKNVAAERN